MKSSAYAIFSVGADIQDTANVDPTDYSDGENINELGIFVGASASAIIAPGETTIPLTEVENAGDPVTIEDALGLAHTSALTTSLIRVITL